MREIEVLREQIGELKLDARRKDELGKRVGELADDAETGKKSGKSLLGAIKAIGEQIKAVGEIGAGATGVMVSIQKIVELLKG